MLNRRVTPNIEEVVGKILDGEAIIINLVTGAYYSMAETGATIWQSIEDGRTVPEIVVALTTKYDIDEDTALKDVERVVEALAVENLVKIVDADKSVSRAMAAESAEARHPYSPPVLNVYRDMRDLLALDPPMPVFCTPPPDDWGTEPKN